MVEYIDKAMIANKMPENKCPNCTFNLNLIQYPPKLSFLEIKYCPVCGHVIKKESSEQVQGYTTYNSNYIEYNFVGPAIINGPTAMEPNTRE